MRRHPPTSYDAKYPNNRVSVTESGHEFHVDDTPGHERIRTAHKSGTYQEVSPDGRRTNLVTNQDSLYVKSGQTITVDGNRDDKVGGSTRESVGGDSHREVAGFQTVSVGSDRSEMVGGDQTTLVGGDRTSGVVGSLTLTIGGETRIKSDGSTTILTGGSLTIEAASSLTIKVGGSTIEVTDGHIKLHSGTLTHNGKNIGDTHEHTGVVPGGALTGPPA